MQSPFQRPRQPWILVAVIAAFLLLALLKPWSFGGDGSSRGSGSRVAIPSGSGHAIHEEPSLAPTPSIPDPNAMPCLTDATEQVVIIERWAGHEVRSWVAAADVTVTGPLDPRLVPMSIFSNHVVGLGICAPRLRTGTQQPAARVLDVESIVQTARGSQTVGLGRPDPIAGQLSGPEPALLYGAPVVVLPRASVGPRGSDPADTALPAPTETVVAWPIGSYAISFRFPSDGPDIVRWLRIDFIRGAGEAG